VLIADIKEGVMNFGINKQSPTLSVLDRLAKERTEQSEKLASGKRINKAADDAAALQIANRLTSQINQAEQQSFNAQDQVNINDTQSAQLSAIEDNLQRASVLSIQAGSPLNDASVIQGELDHITREINVIAESAFGDDQFISQLDATDPAGNSLAIEETLIAVNNANADLGAKSNGLSHQVATYDVSRINVSEARSRIEDADFGKVTSEQNKAKVLLQASIINKRDEESRKGMLIDKLL